MDNMIDQISQILNDPGSMKQIMEIASSMGIKSENYSSESVQPVVTEALTNALQNAQLKDDRQQALVRALLPYLRPGHQQRLERAVQIARLTHLAGAALRSSDKEGAEHV